MNALQAMRKLEKLQDELCALDNAIASMELREADHYHIRLITEMRDKKAASKKDLEDTLEDVDLPKQFY